MSTRIKGFMGRTHVTLALILFAACMLIPLPLLQKTFWVLKTNIPLFIVSLVLVSGGALMPDLDNFNSSMLHSTGPLGKIFMMFMQSSSMLVWNIYHLKNDFKPNNPHRYFWHTPIVGIGLISLFYFGLPAGDYKIFTNIKNSIQAGQFLRFIQSNSILLLFAVLAFMATLAGSSVLLAQLNKIVKVPRLIKYILPVGVLIYINLLATYSDIRIMGTLIGFGYLFHLIADFFSDSGIPVFFPFPIFWRKQAWKRYHFIIPAKTGSISNTIVDFISLPIAIGLFIYIFVSMRGGA